MPCSVTPAAYSIAHQRSPPPQPRGQTAVHIAHGNKPIHRKYPRATNALHKTTADGIQHYSTRRRRCRRSSSNVVISRRQHGQESGPEARWKSLPVRTEHRSPECVWQRQCQTSGEVLEHRKAEKARRGCKVVGLGQVGPEDGDRQSRLAAELRSRRKRLMAALAQGWKRKRMSQALEVPERVIERDRRGPVLWLSEGSLISMLLAGLSQKFCLSEVERRRKNLTISSVPHTQTYKPEKPQQNNHILLACLAPSPNSRSIPP